MDIPKELVNQIARGNCIVFVGAGLSQGAKLPSWPDLLKQMLDWSEKHDVELTDRKELESYIKDGELLLVANEMRERLGKDDFRRFMVEVFRKPGLTPNDTHMLLTKIPFASALTSNYDTLLESAYIIANNGTAPHVFTHSDYPELSGALRSGEFYVLKVHGTVDRIETIILGQSDYREVMHANPAYRQHLKTLFSTKTVMFLGFGLTDPDLMLMLDELKSIFKDYTGKHYSLMDTRNVPSIKQSRFEKDYSIKIIPYTPSGPDHPEVTAFLIDLATQVRQARTAISSIAQVDLTPLEELTAEVRSWLQAIRYKVNEPQRFDERSVSMIASMDLGTVKQNVLVRCIGGEITATDVMALKGALNLKIPQGWLISDKRISQKAVELASGDESVLVFNLTNFLRRMVWGPYFDALNSLVERELIPDRYVDIGCYKVEVDEKGNEIGRERYASLDTYIDDWLKERGKTHISILGDFGAGKTWFCRHYAYRQLERYIKDPAHERLPLLITLRGFTKVPPQQLINDALLEQYKLQFVGSAFEVFKEMNRRGKLLLILDGFDEMAKQVDYQALVDNFWELAKLVEENSKVLLTSRAEYFRGAKESEKVLAGKELCRRFIEITPPNFEILYLQPLSNDQIRRVIILRKGKKEGPNVANYILNEPNLAEMARKPVLVELLLAALDEVKADALENQAKVYLYATNQLLMRNIDTKRTFTETADKLYFLCELAWEMIKSGELRIHYKTIPERIKSYFKEQIKDEHDLDIWDFDLRNQTLLHSNIAGYYEFAHKSLAEYFVAFKFAAELGCIAPIFVQTYCEAEGGSCEIPINKKTLLELAETFGAMSLTDERMDAVRILLKEMMSEDSAKRLWEIVYETRRRTSEEVKYVGGNAATLLRMLDESFVGVKLAHTVLTNADLDYTNLTEADLKGACLRNASLRYCILKNTDLSDTDLTDVLIWAYPDTISLDWSYDDKLLAATNDYYTVIWDTKWRLVSMRAGFDCLTTVKFDSDSHQLFVGDGFTIKILNLPQLEKTYTFCGHSDFIHSIDYDPVKHLIASADQSGKIIIWDPRNGKIIFQNSESNDSMMSICYSSNGMKLLSGGNDQTVRIFDLSNNKIVTKIQVDGTKKPHDPYIWDVRFSVDDKFFAAAISWEKIVKIWETDNGTEVMTLKGHKDAVESIDFIPKQESIVSGSRDGTAIIWDLVTHKPKFILESPEKIMFLRSSHNGRYLATGNPGDVIRIWDVDPNSTICGQCIKVLEMKMNCKGLRISGAHGLEQLIEWNNKGQERKGTILEFFADHGAILNEKQKQILAKTRSQSKDRLQAKKPKKIGS